MKNIVFIIALALAITSAAAIVDFSDPSKGAQRQERRPVKDQYIVVLKDDTSDQQAGEVSASFSGDGIQVKHQYDTVFKGFSISVPAQANDAAKEAILRRIRAHPRVDFVEQDAEVKAAAFGPVISGDSAPTGVSRIGASVNNTVQSTATTSIAVVDTGIDLKHPDLNIGGGYNCFSPRKSAQDDNGHGTHVAGTIAAKNNGAGVVGVAPGSRLYAVKVLDASGSGTISSLVCGVDWVAKNSATYKIKVASVSIGAGGSNDNNCGNSNLDSLHKSICRATNTYKVLFVVAAGNSGVNFVNTVPASYPEVLTVTAFVDSDGRPGGVGGSPSCWAGATDDAAVYFSNFGDVSSSAHVIAAPGVCIRSTWPSAISPYNYNTISGTSMATPHVSGTVALCIGNKGVAGPCNGLTPAQIITYMRNKAAQHAVVDSFLGDPDNPIDTIKYYGHMAWAGDF